MLHDPYHLLKNFIPESFVNEIETNHKKAPIISVDDRITEYSNNTLKLRPKILTIGIGCNRGTSSKEIGDFLKKICQEFNLSMLSIKYLASINIKKDESGLLNLSKEIDVPIRFYNKEELNSVTSIENPSEYAQKYIGARSVCEAAAILASNSGKLIVAKNKTPNVTIAVARKKIIYMS
ncbi:MAG: hypothetical protein OMM_04061 [Candidatus Magnetoglobus multicellularis str. Araruama]|uniref:CobE/GbiG C-terminal domain-containing protein n=1 Tax=Candidatus Magnetoglobus multicellularis str. Araruama TaxID=890399 RepID=A0A1V1P359_9BACT|nr:MAG: hypothetical protein OMM_04061 [Candidatus Magnetoglobus multicellularis str. Araruama]